MQTMLFVITTDTCKNNHNLSDLNPGRLSNGYFMVKSVSYSMVYVFLNIKSITRAPIITSAKIVKLECTSDVAINS
jgi:hypothetical protein